MNPRLLRAILPAALLLAASIPLPGAAAAPVEAPPFPQPFLDTLQNWVDEAANAERPDRPWAAEVDNLLANASAALDEGRFMAALGYYDTAVAYERAQRFWDDTANRSMSARRALLLEHTDADIAAGKAAFKAFRADLATFEQNLTSLKAFESAAYVASLAVQRVVIFDHYHVFRGEVTRTKEIDDSTAYSLFYVTSPVRNLNRYSDLLDAAAKFEGLRPARLTNMTDALMKDYLLRAEGVKEPLLKPFADIILSAAAANETALAFGAYSGLRRAGHTNGIGLIYNDAQARGMNATDTMRKSFTKALEGTNVEVAKDFGLLGLFVLAAKDEGAIALEGNSTLSVLTQAWATQKAAVEVTNDLSYLSPEKPEPKVEGDPESTIPAPSALALLVGLAAAAGLAATRRPR